MFNYSRFKNFDLLLCLTTVLIFCIGLAFLYSATYQHSQTVQERTNGPDFVRKQIVWFAFGLLMAVLISAVDYKKWLEFAYPLYALNFILLLLVLVLGEARLGAQRWIKLGFIDFQPSEFSKLIIVLALARYLGQRKPAFGRTFGSKQALLGSFLLVAAPFLLIVKQPDLGTALTLIPVLLAVLFIWGAPLRSFFFIIAAGLLCTPLLWQMLKGYQKRRILVFLNPDSDPLGAGYTIIQSKIAVGSGRLWGRGWLSGTQNQLNFLPERHTDFIFSVVGEEWGFAGALILLILYLVLIWRLFFIVRHTNNLCARLLACGIITMFSFQVTVNIAMTMGLVPVVGLPLPLISYGGSSLLTTMISLAFVLNIGLRRTVF